jgi:peroxiredoxin family protein
MTSPHKLSLVCFSGDFDKALAAFTLGTGAAAAGWEVSMFFTFWGLNIVKKKRGRTLAGKGLLARAFNFMLGGRGRLPLSRLNFAGVSPVLMTRMMRGCNVATLEELYAAAKDLRVKFVACEMAMHILGIGKADLDDAVSEVVDVATFLDRSRDAHIVFI